MKKNCSRIKDKARLNPDLSALFRRTMAESRTNTRLTLQSRLVRFTHQRVSVARFARNTKAGPELFYQTNHINSRTTRSKIQYTTITHSSYGSTAWHCNYDYYRTSSTFILVIKLLMAPCVIK